MGSDDFDAQTNNAPPSASVAPTPSKAIRAHCLSCCGNSAYEVSRCPATSCSLWTYRFGPAPTASMLEEAGDALVYPLEDRTTVTEFSEKGGTRLKAVKRRCRDCAGGSKADVRDCQHVACDLHHFRLGRNPNRSMSAEQREIAAVRLKANVERGKAATMAGGQNFAAHVRKKR